MLAQDQTVTMKDEEKDFATLLFEQSYVSRVDWFRYLNRLAEPGGIVFVGDSITQEFMVTEIYRGKNVYNRGIGGDTTEGLFKRLEESVFQLKPKTIFLLIGTNDLALLDTTPERIAGNIREICREIVDRLPQSTLVLESIYPTISPVFSEITPEAMKARANNVIDYTNGLLQQVAAELGIVYLDINRHLKDETGLLQPDYTRDGLHLTPKGYTIVQQCIKPFIEG